MTEEERQDEIQKKLDKKLSDIRLRVLQIANTIIMKPEMRRRSSASEGHPEAAGRACEASRKRARRAPYTVETLAIELRHLAYQTRFFQKAKEGAFLAL